MAQVKLVYIIDVGSQDPSNFLAKVSNVRYNDGTVEALGFDFVGDVTTVVTLPEGDRIRHEITLETNAQGDTMWPTAEEIKNATRNIFNQSYELGVPALVAAEEPVVL